MPFRKALFVPLALAAAGAWLAWEGSQIHAPEKDSLVEMEGQVVSSRPAIKSTGAGVGTLVRVHWDDYLGHDLTLAPSGGGWMAVRVPSWTRIDRAKLDRLGGAHVLGRYHPGDNTVYELVAGRDVLTTYYASSRNQTGAGQSKLWIGLVMAAAGAIAFGLLWSKDNPQPVTAA